MSLSLAGQTVFDLATDAVMKQVLEGSVHRVSVQLWVLQLLASFFCFAGFFFSLSLSEYESPCQEVRRAPLKGEPHVKDDHNSDRWISDVQVINIST